MFHLPEMGSYKRAPLPASPSLADLRAVAPEYGLMLVTVMEAIADRYERRPDYPFVDTKLDLMTGADFDPHDPIRGLSTVYGWIQGRALEAMVDHLRWLRRHWPAHGLIPRLEAIVRRLSDTLWRIWRENEHHLFFSMTPEGAPIVIRQGQRLPLTEWDRSAYSFADTFGAKGLYAAACYLGDQAAAAEALRYCLHIDEAIRAERFAMDERNGVIAAPAAQDPRSQAPRMIQLGTAALLATYAHDPAVIELGLDHIRYILQHHVASEGAPGGFLPGDLWEMIGPDGAPFREGDAVRCIPGHAIEFAGLSLKFTAAALANPACTPAQRQEIQQLQPQMLPILFQNFANGFVPEAGGIVQSIDLVSRAPMTEAMPWWCLPETIRAAALCWSVAQNEADRARCLEILSLCHNGFVTHYVRPELHLMAYQTRSTAGRPVAVVPATPDADPGYHTGASILDFLQVLERDA